MARGARGARIVKLGGGLGARDAEEFRAFALAVLAAGVRCVVAPGGGPFADAVRDAQPRYGFCDRAAHRMALLAMEQMAHAIAALDRRFRVCASPPSFAECWARGRTPVWAPSHMAVGRTEITESWDVTSDSLALWLAGEIGADAVCLVKPVAPEARDPAALARAGVVDAAFADFAERIGVPVHVFGPGEAAMLARILAGRKVGEGENGGVRRAGKR